jgi:hypothetical protein
MYSSRYLLICHIPQNEFKHFIEQIWNEDAPITLKEALSYLEDQDETQSEIYTMRQIEKIVSKYPGILYPVYRIQIQMIDNTMGHYWWDNHKAWLKEKQQEQQMRALQDLEQRKKHATSNEETAALEMVKARMGITYYLMPWMIKSEMKKLAKIAAIEKELESTLLMSKGRY